MLHLYRETKLTVLTHFYNEEFLLPHWLSHHVKLFDHGIMVNYASTDKSVDIIKKYAPTWDVVQSKNDHFDAALCDYEMMQHEETVEGWKVVLNVTEFVFDSDLRSKLKYAKSPMLRFKGYQINDTAAERDEGLDDSKPLLVQRFNGMVDPWRNRIIHCLNNGGYYIGRHYGTPGLKPNPHSKSRHGTIPFGEDLRLFWYRFSPYNEQIPRKLQISDRIPQSDIDKGLGWNHWSLDEAKIEERWKEVLPKCKDVRDDDCIKKEYDKMLVDP